MNKNRSLNSPENAHDFSNALILLLKILYKNGAFLFVFSEHLKWTVQTFGSRREMETVNSHDTVTDSFDPWFLL